MKLENKKLLEDIRYAADWILRSARGKSLEAYEGDETLRLAVERQFLIIGEAFNRLAKRDPATADRVGDVGEIVAFRNRLVHGYDAMTNETVLDIIDDELSPLLDKVTAMLAEETEY